MGKKSHQDQDTHTNRSAEVGHADGVDIFTVGAAQQEPALNVQGVDRERLVTDEGVDFQLGRCFQAQPGTLLGRCPLAATCHTVTQIADKMVVII